MTDETSAIRIARRGTAGGEPNIVSQRAALCNMALRHVALRPLGRIAHAAPQTRFLDRRARYVPVRARVHAERALQPPMRDDVGRQALISKQSVSSHERPYDLVHFNAPERSRPVFLLSQLQHSGAASLSCLRSDGLGVQPN